MRPPSITTSAVSSRSDAGSTTRPPRKTRTPGRISVLIGDAYYPLAAEESSLQLPRPDSVVDSLERQHPLLERVLHLAHLGDGVGDVDELLGAVAAGEDHRHLGAARRQHGEHVAVCSRPSSMA